MNKKKLKKINVWIVAATIIFSFSFTAGCQQEEFIQIEDEVCQSKSEKIDEPTTWSLSYETLSQQLAYLINERPEMDFITGQGLHLIDYKILDYRINKDAPLNENAFMPLYNDPRDTNNFIILSLSEIRQIDPSTASRYENGLKKILLDEYSPSELRNVELTWRYKNENFTTTCFVTDKEVVYDDILSNIRRIVVHEPEVVMAKNTPRLKSAGENENGGEDGDISYYGQTPKIYIHTWSGGMVAYAYCEYWVYGRRINGEKYLESAECNPYAWSEAGYYYADAAIKVTSLISGKEGDGSVYFAYGCAVSSYYVSILWDDFQSQYIVNSVSPPYGSLISNVSVAPSMLY